MREIIAPGSPDYTGIAQDIAASLDTVARERFHQAHGPGYAMPVGESTDLGLYPQSNRVKTDVMGYIGKGMGMTVRGEPSAQWGNTRLTNMSLKPQRR